MDLKDVISLVDLAARFAKAKGMDNIDYQWLRTAPGRGSRNRDKVGNSLALLKAIRSFNESNSKPIQVYNAKGYDGTPKKVMVIEKSEIIRLKGFLLRGGSQKRGRTKESTDFKIIGKAEI
jgi:hypothetical protein